MSKQNQPIYFDEIHSINEIHVKADNQLQYNIYLFDNKCFNDA